MMFRYAACLTTLVVPGLLLPFAATAGEPRAVIELFTSQGCSSCPPADKLAAEFARDPSLIVMSLAVDYWDYLGWKDTLALHGHANRERAYAVARGDRDVYTPQAVINGAIAVIGSDKSEIDGAIARTGKDPAVLGLPVTVKISGDTIVVDVPDAKDAHRSGEVWLCPITGKVTVMIERGENSGHTLTYTNVVRNWVKLGDWTGKAQTFSAPLSAVANKDVDSYTVLVQSGAAAKPGPLLGAAAIAAH